MTARRADVVIVGAGIAGTASAWYLARRGLSVTVCEKGRVAGEQSSRNWGFVRQQGRDPAEIPLMMESNRIWQGLERDLNADLEWIQGGNCMVFQSDEDAAFYEDWLQTATSHGLSARILSAAELRALIPGSDLGQRGAIYTESDGQAEPRKVTLALQRAAEGSGATFLTGCAAYAFVREGGRVTGVLTEQGEIRAGTVVLAGGAWSSRMLAHLGIRLPQVWITGSVARTTAAPVLSPAATWAGVAFRQRRDGTMNIATRSVDHDLMAESLLFGWSFREDFRKAGRDLRMHVSRLGVDLALGRVSVAALRRELTRYRTLDPAPNMALLQDVLARLKQAVPGVGDIRIDHAWAGYIDMLPDMQPVIEAPAAAPGLVIATGFSGHGFGMGPIVGRLVSEIIADGQPSLDLSAFRLDRF